MEHLQSKDEVLEVKSRPHEEDSCGLLVLRGKA